jgi:hypothetical protein
MNPDGVLHACAGSHVNSGPDPTYLTTQALTREVNNLKEMIEARIDAQNRATTLLQEASDRGPAVSVVEERVNSLVKLTEEKFTSVQAQQAEKFESIQIQFRERDTRTDQTSRDAKTAVDAALQAAKEAVGEQNKSGALAIAKSEASTIKQIDQIAILLQNVNKASDDKISDLKDRLTMIEGRSGGQGSLIAYMFAGLGLVGTLVGVVYAITHR